VTPAVLLWDFGDTLVDERWLRRAPESYPDWVDAWSAVMDELADAWNLGACREADVFAAVAARTGMSQEAVERHVDACCRTIERHPAAWRVAAAHGRPQALVTVNPDLFVTREIPALGLAGMFETIVVSSVEGTDDKVEVCLIALDRLGFDGARRDALLIDNRADLVAAWRAAGGTAYHYTDDATFAADAVLE
jgi:phosphoglycolate phosphatase-like HAD superfamily hydrolase